MKDRLKAAMYGVAIGDALGVPVEFKQRGTFQICDMVGYGTHNQPKGTWSDDTSLTIATCDSIRECQGIHILDMQEKFRRWLHNGEYTVDGKVFDCGITTRIAIEQGFGEEGEMSNGNGSLMRILPLAFADVRIEDVEEVSAITHGHQISEAACVCCVNIARNLLKGYSLEELLDLVHLGKPFDRIPIIKTLKEDEIRSTGYVVDTLEAALWALSTTDNFRDAVLKAVNLGNDTDTVGAVTGGLAGIMYGMEGIPKEWIETLRGKEIIEKCLF